MLSHRLLLAAAGGLAGLAGGSASNAGPATQAVNPSSSPLEIFGIRLIGINWESGKKLLFTLVLIVGLLLISKLLRSLARGLTRRSERVAFWVRQGIRVLAAIILIIGIVSIWFDNPARLATAAGLVTAGLAFALQRVITAFAGYFVILRGKTFNVGDRIVMGGVRGDVIALGFMQTTIMEMGQPPGEQADSPSMWVHARQYTGRIVTVINAKVFDEPIYNYTHMFPYIWEEMRIPISYKDDRHKAEQIILAAAEHHTVKISEMSQHDLAEMERRYSMRQSELHPKVYLRITDNWVELTVRFIAHESGVRDLKNAMSREILSELEAAGIGIASGTYDIVGLPPIRIQRLPVPQDAAHGNGR